MSSAIMDDDGILYFTNDESGKLYALDRNGELKWEINLADSRGYPTTYTSPSIGKDGTIYVNLEGGSEFFSVVSINPDGTEKWRFTGDGDLCSYRIVFGKDDTPIFTWAKPICLNNDGSLKWTFMCPEREFDWDESYGPGQQLMKRDYMFMANSMLPLEVPPTR